MQHAQGCSVSPGPTPPAGALFGGLARLGSTGTVQLKAKKEEKPKGPANKSGRDDSVVRGGGRQGGVACWERAAMEKNRHTCAGNLPAWVYVHHVLPFGVQLFQLTLGSRSLSRRYATRHVASALAHAGLRGWRYRPHGRPRGQVRARPGRPSIRVPYITVGSAASSVLLQPPRRAPAASTDGRSWPRYSVAEPYAQQMEVQAQQLLPYRSVCLPARARAGARKSSRAPARRIE